MRVCLELSFSALWQRDVIALGLYGYTLRQGWDGRPTGKYDIRVGFPQIPENLTKKNQHEQIGTQNRAAQLSLARRGQRHRWTGHSTVRRKSNPLNTSIKIKKKGIRKRGPTLEKMRAIKLFSHTMAMDLMVQFPGDGVVPW